MGGQVFRWCIQFSMRGGLRGVRGSMGEDVSFQLLFFALSLLVCA